LGKEGGKGKKEEGKALEERFKDPRHSEKWLLVRKRKKGRGERAV